MALPSISNRGQAVIASPIRKFLPLMQDTQKKGIHVYKLNTGDPDVAVPQLFFKTLRHYHKKNLSYAPSPGEPDHVAAWIEYYRQWGVNLEPSNIIPTVGCAEAILFAMMAVADVGDEIIVFEPLYVSYKSFAVMIGITLVPITLEVEKGLRLPPLAKIAERLSPKTKAIVVINPDNPTGKLWTAKELKRIIRFARLHNIFLIADETYREICFTGKPSCMLSYPQTREHVILVDSVSKRYSMPGARVGCLISYNQALMQSVLKFAQARLSVGTLEQYALIPVLRHSKALTTPVRREYQKRRDVVYAALSRMPGVVCGKPEGAFYIIVKLPIGSAEEFVKFLIRDFSYHNETIMVSPLQDFYITPGLGRNEIRIAYVLNAAALKRAMKIFAKGLVAYLKTG
ncbi:pyridoxal phosphate-dependent aminotransferase [Candidatus Uhrbacteria bacterium]|nr:pyridoxal phosphate-dependent aminotransferase [Candidatus Uhrbacteria bacterium]